MRTRHLDESVDQLRVAFEDERAIGIAMVRSGVDGKFAQLIRNRAGASEIAELTGTPS